MYFLIGADLVPTESNRLLFEAGDIKELLGEELTAYLNKAEYRIFNLETPLTEQESPLPKCGPNLSAPTKTVNAMKKMHIMPPASDINVGLLQQSRAAKCLFAINLLKQLVN